MKLSSIFFSLSKNFRRVAMRLSRNDEWRNTLNRWKADNKDKDLRTHYPELNADSVVFDLGGYEGQWASDIYGIYLCNVEVFEPYEPYAKAINERFKRNKAITVHVFGLSGKDDSLEIGVAADSTSVFKISHASQVATVQLKEARAFLKANKFEQIDLMKINIEGGEYELLEHLIAEGLVSQIKNLQVQFHDFVYAAESRMQSIQADLAKTHELTYQYGFLWENWKLK